MNETEKESLESFADMIHDFFENRKNIDYKNIVGRMLTAYKAHSCNITLKIHFLHSHLDYFPRNLGVYAEQERERFHDDLKNDGKTLPRKIECPCDSWMLKRKNRNTGRCKRSKRSLKIIKRHFIGQKCD